MRFRRQRALPLCARPLTLERLRLRPDTMASIDRLVARLGIVFNDLRLLESALVHSSLHNERPHQTHMLESSERLEFLGDSVLNYIAADLVYRRFPGRGEGELTELRAALIKTTTLARFARELELGRYLRLSKGEESSGGRDRDSLLADMFEAVVAAIYLDRGLEAARGFLLPMLEQEISQILTQGLAVDYKTRLQERVQAERNITPLYRFISVEGPEHKRTFTVEVMVGEDVLGVGQGHSKAAATQDAARAALERLDSL